MYPFAMNKDFDIARRNLDYWVELINIVRLGPLAWEVSPNVNWPKQDSFGFYFSRECLSSTTPCKFMSIDGTDRYRLTFPAPIETPELHPLVMEAALWERLP